MATTDPFSWIPIRPVQTVSEYVQAVMEISEAWMDGSFLTDPYSDTAEARRLRDVEIWYRGQGDIAHALAPGAYRAIAGRVTDSNSMFNRFACEAAALLEPRPADDWEWYFAAQHYGVPTRLLDWTQDALAALYFALRSGVEEHQSLPSGLVPVVWIMDAGSLNNISIGDDNIYVPSTGKAPSPGKSVTAMWLPEIIDTGTPTTVLESRDNTGPLAIYPAHTTSRIAAQSGCFTVHGLKPDGIESHFRGPDRMHRHLSRVKISHPARVDRELHHLGYTKFKLFPEPSYLATKLRRLYTGPQRSVTSEPFASRRAAPPPPARQPAPSPAARAPRRRP